jgi:hypothetical protein
VQGDGGPALKPSGLISHFVGHVCLGALGFIVLAIPAILFSLAAHSGRLTSRGQFSRPARTIIEW